MFTLLCYLYRDLCLSRDSIPDLVGCTHAHTLPFSVEDPSYLKFQNALCCPIAVIACYSGSSKDDHHVCRLSPDGKLIR